MFPADDRCSSLSIKVFIDAPIESVHPRTNILQPVMGRWARSPSARGLVGAVRAMHPKIDCNRLRNVVVVGTLPILKWGRRDGSNDPSNASRCLRHGHWASCGWLAPAGGAGGS